MADRPIIIAASIPSADIGRLAEELRALDSAKADWIPIDVMDGRFVPNISFGLMVLESVRRAKDKPVNVHLMVVEPEHNLADSAKAGSRINLTYPALKSTQHAAFLVVGNDGAPILGRLLLGDQSLPAARLHPIVYFWIFHDAEARSAA